jgi:hypothetical protein
MTGFGADALQARHWRDKADCDEMMAIQRVTSASRAGLVLLAALHAVCNLSKPLPTRCWLSAWYELRADLH